MSSTIITIIIWVAAISSGLMAGVYFAFSGFIMKSFDTLEPSQAISAMNAINKIILRSLFMPLFFGSTLVSVLLVVVGILNWGDKGAEFSMFAGLIYFIGMFVCTIVFNVPLNNSLASEDPNSDQAQQTWSDYRNNWTKGNHLRTISSLLTSMLSIWILSSY